MNFTLLKLFHNNKIKNKIKINLNAKEVQKGC